MELSKQKLQKVRLLLVSDDHALATLTGAALACALLLDDDRTHARNADNHHCSDVIWTGAGDVY